jgi:hypothetical protein
MLTLNQIKQVLNAIKTNQKLITNGTFLFDNDYEFGTESPITYPLVGVELGDADLNDKIITNTFTIYFLDLVNQDKSNKDEVLSDMLLAGMNFYSKLKAVMQYEYGGTVTLTTKFSPAIGILDDDVYGTVATISIEQFYDNVSCDFGGSTFPSNSVTIVDQDGNVLATITAPGSYTVTVLSTIQDTIDSNAFTIIENLT